MSHGSAAPAPPDLRPAAHDGGPSPVLPWRVGFQLSPPGPPRRLRTGASLGPVGPEHEAPPADAGWWWSGEVRSGGPVSGGGWEGVLATAEPGGRGVRLRVDPAGDGATAVAVSVAGPDHDVAAVGQRFAAGAGEWFFGFGERSDAVARRHGVVEHYVGEGPWQPGEYPFLDGIVPEWGLRQRADATYFPVPWVLSSRGYGVLVTSDELSYVHLRPGGAPEWRLEVEGRAFGAVVYDGPRPLDALARAGAVLGRQPEPRPWWFGPWFQTGHDNHVPLAEERRLLGLLRRGRAPVSAAETHCRFLPVGEHRGHLDQERARTAYFHGEGLAVLSYLNPLVSTDFPEAWGPAEAAGALQRRPGGAPYAFEAYAGGRTPPVTTEAQYDFGTHGAEACWGAVAAELVGAGHDGWMEDFGEYTPLDAEGRAGPLGTAGHNRYPTEYHGTADAVARRLEARAGRPLARFVRSGWTGTAPHAPIVWGGDPTTDWGFDGLASAVVEGLSAGASGIAMWGSDIGGFMSGEARLTPELLVRWLQFGAHCPVMRTKSAGIEVHRHRRPQIWDPDVLPHWARWAAWHTQLNGYLRAAHDRYRRHGHPIMTALGLAWPDDPAALACADQYLFGPDLLVAPVLGPGQSDRRLHLPAGRWVDLWRGSSYDPATRSLTLTGGAPVLAGPGPATVPAPLAEIPLLVRAGAVLCLLAPDIDTLSPYPPPAGLVGAAARRGVRHLLAFPGGAGSGPGPHGSAERVWCEETADGFVLGLPDSGPRTYHLQADLGGLARPLRVGSVTLDETVVDAGRWSADPGRGLLTLSVAARGGRLVVRGAQP